MLHQRIFCFLLTGAVISLGQELCRSTGTPQGKCLPFDDCHILKPLTEVMPITNFLRIYGGCGSKDGDNIIRVCCPLLAYPPSPTTPSPPWSPTTPSPQIPWKPSPPWSPTTPSPPWSPTTPSPPWSPTTQSPPVSKCKSPSKLLPSLGCVTPVTRKMTWDNAMHHCRSLEGDTTLLQGITSQVHLDVIKENFKDSFNNESYLWIGLRGSKWIADLSPPSTLPWGDGHLEGGDDDKCGYVCLLCSPRPSLYDFPCHPYTAYFLCQRRE